MNRDDLLEAVFGWQPEDEPAARFRLVELEEDAENPSVVHTRAVIAWDYRPVIVYNPAAPGAGATEAATTIRVAAVVYLATDPDHRGRGLASKLLSSFHRDAATHRGIDHACLFAGDDVAAFFEARGYEHPERAPAGFLVCELEKRAVVLDGGREREAFYSTGWPAGQVRTLDGWQGPPAAVQGGV